MSSPSWPEPVRRSAAILSANERRGDRAVGGGTSGSGNMDGPVSRMEVCDCRARSRDRMVWAVSLIRERVNASTETPQMSSTSTEPAGMYCMPGGGTGGVETKDRGRGEPVGTLSVRHTQLPASSVPIPLSEPAERERYEAPGWEETALPKEDLESRRESVTRNFGDVT